MSATLVLLGLGLPATIPALALVGFASILVVLYIDALDAEFTFESHTIARYLVVIIGNPLLYWLVGLLNLPLMPWFVLLVVSLLVLWVAQLVSNPLKPKPVGVTSPRAPAH